MWCPVWGAGAVADTEVWAAFSRDPAVAEALLQRKAEARPHTGRLRRGTTRAESDVFLGDGVEHVREN